MAFAWTMGMTTAADPTSSSSELTVIILSIRPSHVHAREKLIDNVDHDDNNNNTFNSTHTLTRAITLC